MKIASKLFIFTGTLLALSVSVYADSPREQLNQLVQQVKKTPGDSALRQHAIKLGVEINPPPVIPDEANRREGRAKFAFRSAKSIEDLLAAAAEYEEAAKAAPWVGGYYADLCTIYEKAENYSEAKRNCELYLSSLSDPTQLKEIKQRIAGLEFGIEKTNSPQAREAPLLQKVEKARFVDDRHRGSGGRLSFDDIFEVKDGVLFQSIRINSMGSGNARMLSYQNHDQPGLYSAESAPYRDGAFTISSYGITCVYRIRQDALALLKRCSNWQASDPDDTILRQ
jgi:hypothetical protein